MARHTVPAQYTTYSQPHPLKPYQPYVARSKATLPADVSLKLAKPAEEVERTSRRGGKSGTPPCYPLTRKPSVIQRCSATGGTSSREKSTSSHLLSSTPHAPRQKRSVLDLISHADFNVLPSTHELLRKHTYLDSGHLRSEGKKGVLGGRGEGEGPGRPVSWDSKGVGRMKEREDGEGKGEWRKREDGGGKGEETMEKKLMIRRQAWQDKSREEERKMETDQKVTKIQPFRRTVTSSPPEGIPLLDLTKLNEPDHDMEPIELICAEDDGGRDTARSAMSWGVPFSSSPDHNGKLPDDHQSDPTGEKTEAKERGGEREREGEIVEEVEEILTDSRQTHMDTNHAKFVEEKILSHERAISSLSPHPHPLPPPPSPGHTSTKPPQKVSTALRSHLTFGVGVAEADLSRRLRFEARVLTHNGRDVHRELCGFFFLADSSITVYEFRQFGKKSSALPLVQRKVYCHQLGHRKGEPYQINFIRKGSTLHFPTSLLPSLPESMSSRSLLSLRITQCSERDKRQLLCANRTPMECVSIDHYIHHPLSHDQQQDWNSLRTLQGIIRRQLLGRARKTLVGLGRLLTHGSLSLTVTRPHLKSSLHTYHIHLTDQEFGCLWRLLTCLEEFAGCDGVRGEGGGENVRGDRCVAGLVGEMNEERKALVRKVFQKLDSLKTGLVTITSIQRFYRHPTDDIVGVWFDHTHRTPQHTAMTTINYADFENYYEGASMETPRDSEFITDLKTCWTI